MTRHGALARRTVMAMLAMADIALLELCVVGGRWLRFFLADWLPPINLAPSTFHGLYLAVLAIPLGCLLWRLYPGYGLSPVDRLRRRTLVTLVGFGLMILYDRLGQGGQWSRGVLSIASVLALVSFPLGHLLARWLLSRLGWWGEPVVVLGPPERRQRLAEILAAQPELGWIAVCHGDWPPQNQPGWRDVDMALLAPPPGALNLSAVVDGLPFRRFVVIPDFGGRSLGVMAHETALGLGLEVRNNLLYPLNGVLKRCVDLVGVVVLAPVAVPVIVLFALLVKVSSPGPAFYAQWREGKGGVLFRLWKIRSMVPDAEHRLGALVDGDGVAGQEWRATMKLSRDPRVIPGVGRFIRRFSIDELPQLFNVLLGHMSLVGPRPLPAYHLANIAHDQAQLRRKVRPGITGWAQISGRSLSTVDQQVEFDIYYIRNWSFWIDLYVAGRTIGVILSAHGAY